MLHDWKMTETDNHVEMWRTQAGAHYTFDRNDDGTWHAMIIQHNKTRRGPDGKFRGAIHETYTAERLAQLKAAISK